MCKILFGRFWQLPTGIVWVNFWRFEVSSTSVVTVNDQVDTYAIKLPATFTLHSFLYNIWMAILNGMWWSYGHCGERKCVHAREEMFEREYINLSYPVKILTVTIYHLIIHLICSYYNSTQKKSNLILHHPLHKYSSKLHIPQCLISLLYSSPTFTISHIWNWNPN